MRDMDPTVSDYSKKISRGVESQQKYRQKLGQAMKHGAQEERIDTIRAHEDVRSAVARGLMPMPAWLAEMDRQRAAVTGRVAARPTRKRVKVAQTRRPRVAPVVSVGMEALVAKLRSAWIG